MSESFHNLGRPNSWPWCYGLVILLSLLGMLANGEPAPVHQPGVAPVLSGCEPDYPPYCIVTPENQADGFSVELLRATLKAMGREVAFRTGPWAELKQELTDGKLEVLPLVGRTPEREALYDFTVPYLTIHGALFIRRDTADIRTWEDVKDKRVAVMKGDNAEEYVRRVHLSDRILTSPSFEGAFQMLADGRADAVVAQKLMGVSLLKHMGLASIQVVGRPSEEFTQTFSFAVRKGNGKLLATLNEGLAIVLAEGINWKLERKWMGGDARETALARVLIYGGDSAFPPYEFLDEKGRPSGFNIELARAVARQMGVDISFQLAPWTEVRRKIENGELDLACMFYSASRARLVEFAVPHTLVYQAVFARKDSPSYRHMDDLKGRRISVQNGDIMHEYAVEHGLGDMLILAATSEEALALLEKGQVDYTLGTHLQGLHWIKKNGWRNLRAVETRLLGTEYGYAIPKGNTALRDLFNDGLRQTKETGEYRNIYNKWLGVLEPDYEWRRIAKTVLRVSVSASLLAALALGIIFTLRRQVRNRTRELSFERAFLDRIINAIPVRVFWKDENLLYLGCNAAFARDAGFADPQDIIGKDDYQMGWRDQAEMYRADDRIVIASGHPRLLIQEHQTTPAGDTIWLITSKVPLRDPTGEIRGVLGTYMDITERKQAEVALRDSEQRYRALFEGASEGILVADAETRKFRYANPAICTLLGYTAEELTKMDVQRIHPAESLPAVIATFEAQVRGELRVAPDMPCLRKNGEILHVNVNTARVEIDGRPSLVGFFTDMTDHKRQQAERREMEKQLQEKQKLAAVGTLACGMGHEITNPLMGIINYAQLIKDRLRDKDEALEGFAGEIVIEAERIAGIVRSLSAFASRATTLHVSIPVGDLVESALVPLRDAFAHDQIALEVDLPDNLPAVVCDRGQIVQVLTSLLNNARDALNERYPGSGDDKVIVVSARTIAERGMRNADSGKAADNVSAQSAIRNPKSPPSEIRNPQSAIRITVEDHGIGIPKAVREHIFEPFFTTKDRSIGAGSIGKGLGLFVSYACLEEHGGLLSVESEVDQWTRFHVDLPVGESVNSEGLLGQDGDNLFPPEQVEVFRMQEAGGVPLDPPKRSCAT